MLPGLPQLRTADLADVGLSAVAETWGSMRSPDERVQQENRRGPMTSILRGNTGEKAFLRRKSERRGETTREGSAFPQVTAASQSSSSSLVKCDKCSTSQIVLRVT